MTIANFIALFSHTASDNWIVSARLAKLPNRLAITWTIAAVAFLVAGRDAATQQRGALGVTAGHGASVEALTRWDETIRRMTPHRRGGCRLAPQ